MAGADVLGGGGECGGEGVRFADGAAEECVDEAACTAGEGDGFVDYGVCGDAQVKELVEAEAEDLACLGVELAVAEAGDEEVERGEHTIDNGLCDNDFLIGGSPKTVEICVLTFQLFA